MKFIYRGVEKNGVLMGFLLDLKVIGEDYYFNLKRRYIIFLKLNKIFLFFLKVGSI